jgi:hypothetical protein
MRGVFQIGSLMTLILNREKDFMDFTLAESDVCRQQRPLYIVTPAEAGVHPAFIKVDSRFRGNDKNFSHYVMNFLSSIIKWACNPSIGSSR